MVDKYIPRRGDIIWLDLDPVLGHEQGGHRPVLVISHTSYNKKTGLAIVCPLTSKKKGYSLEVDISQRYISGVALSNHVRSIDWEARDIEYIDTVSESTVDRIVTQIGRIVS